MNDRVKITTPKGAVVKTQNGTAKLTWNPGFDRNWNGQYSRAQTFVDSEVLRLCSKRVPFQTGMLDKSGILGTEIGSGIVAWIAPYAKSQYYLTAPTRSYDIMRGGLWFERMKADHKKEIIAGAKARAGGSK